MGKQVISVDMEAAKEKLASNAKRMGETVKSATASTAQKLKERLLNSKSEVLGRLVDAGIKASEKQLAVLKSLK